ncbi:hypothetical protein JCM8547_004564 [Rhodosporidiobolus lusitaniae]
MSSTSLSVLPGSAQTINRAELYALARVLKRDRLPRQALTIYTNSGYAIDANRPVANEDLIRYVLSLLDLRRASASSARQHDSSTSPTGNVAFKKLMVEIMSEEYCLADQLAQAAAAEGVAEER